MPETPEEKAAREKREAEEKTLLDRIGKLETQLKGYESQLAAKPAGDPALSKKIEELAADIAALKAGKPDDFWTDEKRWGFKS